MNATEEAILEALGAGDAGGRLDLTFSDILAATDLTPQRLDTALYDLCRKHQVRRLPGGRYRCCDLGHSRAVKRGLFVRKIPRLALACAYVAPVYPLLERLRDFTGNAL